MLRASDIWNLIISCLGMGGGAIMSWRNKPNNEPREENRESENDAQYRWADGNIRTPEYDYWQAGESDYHRDERNYWRRSFWINIATLVAAIFAGYTAHNAFIETRRQADAAIQELNAGKRASILAHDIAIQFPGLPSAGIFVRLINSGPTYGYLQRIGLVLMSIAKNEQLSAQPIYPTIIEKKILVPNNTSEGATTGKIPVPPIDRGFNEIDVTEATALAFTNHIKAGGDRNLFVYGFLEYSDEYSASYKNIWNGFCFQFYPDRDIKSSEGDDRFSVCSGNVEAYVYTKHTEANQQAK